MFPKKIDKTNKTGLTKEKKNTQIYEWQCSWSRS
jgi:hypothetical protein